MLFFKWREPLQSRGMVKKNHCMATAIFSANNMWENRMYFLGASLLFFVLSTTNILIYNEELIILMCFVAFLTTCLVTMSETIAETFQARKALIQEELQALFITKENMLHEVKHHTIMQTALAHSMIAIGSLVEKEVHVLHTQRVMALKNVTFTRNVKQLQGMEAAESACRMRTETLASAAYKLTMMHEYHMDKKDMQKQFMQNALHLLQNMHQKKMHKQIALRILQEMHSNV